MSASVLEDIGGLQKVEALCAAFYEKLSKDEKFRNRDMDVEELVAIQSSLFAQKLGGTADPKSSIHTAHEKYNFSPQDVAYATEMFLEVMQSELSAGLFVTVSKILVAEDTKVLQGVARSESSLQGTGTRDHTSGMSLDLSEHLAFTLDPEQIQLIRQHLHDTVAAVGSLELTGEVMIENIMSADPGLNKLFSQTPVKVQGFRFISQVARFVQYLTDIENLESELYALGMRHVSYITVEEGKRYLKKVIASLLKTIGGVLDEAWNNYAAETWTTFFEYLAAHLLGNLAEFSGKIAIIKGSWDKITDASSTAIINANMMNDEDGVEDLLDDEAREKIRKGKVEEARDKHIQKNCEIFGESLFFNLSVMSKELTAIFAHVATQNLSREFGLTVGKLVTNVSDPEELNEELYVLSLRHINYGAQRSHFTMFGQAFIVTLRSLLPRDWNRAHEEAWVWLWNICEKYMTDCLDDGRISKRVIDETVVRIKTINMNVFFEKYVTRLFTNDEVAGFFAKPKGLFRYIVSKAMGFLTSLHHTPKQTCGEIRALGMRHVKYSPPDHLLPLVGLALIYTMSAMLEGFWTEQVEFGWCKAFEYICRTIARALKNGSSLVCNCILRDSLEDLESTLQQAPRGVRCMWMLEVRAIGATLSPVYWCLFDAKTVMLSAMLKDLLIIRADSEDYYLGVREIFVTHPNFVHNVCLLQPGILPQFLDGLMWVSQVEGTTRRFIYFVECIYGNPFMERFVDPHRTALASMLKVPNVPDVFGHDVVQFVILHKWRGYAHSFFMKNVSPYLLQAMLVVVCFVILHDDAKIHDGGDNEVTKYISFTLRILVSLGAAILLGAIQGRRVYQELQRNQVFVFTLFGIISFKLPFFLKKLSNVAQFLVNLCLMIAIFCDNWVMGDVYADWFGWEGQDKTDNIVGLKRVHRWFLSIAFVLYFPIVVDCYLLQRNLAPLRIQLQMLMAELSQIVPFIMVILMAFAGSMLAMEYPDVVLAAGHYYEFEDACAAKCAGRMLGQADVESFSELGMSEFMPNPAGRRNLMVNVEKPAGASWGWCDASSCTTYNMAKFDPEGVALMAEIPHEKSSFLIRTEENFTGDFFQDYQHSLFTLMIIGFGNYGVNPNSFTSQGELFLCMFGIIMIIFFFNILFSGFAAAAYYVFEEIEALNYHAQASEIIEIETVMGIEDRQIFWKSLLFENRVPFTTGDSGLTGGIQITEHVTSRRVSPDKVDCITRHAGAAGADRPWPVLQSDQEQTAEMRLSRVEKHFRRLHKQMREVLKGNKGAGTGTGTGSGDHTGSDA